MVLMQWLSRSWLFNAGSHSNSAAAPRQWSFIAVGRTRLPALLPQQVATSVPLRERA
jgi:hypothetical protein